MTGIITSGEKRLIIVSGRAHPQLAKDVAKELGTQVLSSTAYDFSNGETYVRFNESVRGCDVFVVQSHGDRVNDWLMEQFIMVDDSTCVPSSMATSWASWGCALPETTTSRFSPLVIMPVMT